MIHVRDLVRGLILAATVSPGSAPSGEIFYLAHDDVNSYDEMIECIASKLKKDPIRVRIPKVALVAAAYAATGLGKLLGKTFNLNRDKLDELLADYWTCSPVKAKLLLGFQAEYDMKKGMNHVLDWYVKNGWL